MLTKEAIELKALAFHKARERRGQNKMDIEALNENKTPAGVKPFAVPFEMPLLHNTRVPKDTVEIDIREGSSLRKARKIAYFGTTKYSLSLSRGQFKKMASKTRLGGLSRGKLASFATPLDPPAVARLSPLSPRDANSVASRYVRCTDYRQSPSRTWPFRNDKAIYGSESGENPCNLHSATRRS